MRRQEIIASSVLLATGLVDARPPIDGLSDGVYSGAVRFCPICDGFEATDQRVGVMGDVVDAGKKALFLRTYTRQVILFATDDEGNSPAGIRLQLSEAGVTMAGKPIAVERKDGKVAVTVDGGTRRAATFYPALGCTMRPSSPPHWAPVAMGPAISAGPPSQTTVDSHATGDVVTDLHQLSVATRHAAFAA